MGSRGALGLVDPRETLSSGFFILLLSLSDTMGRALLSLLKADGSTVLVWDLKLARELLGLPSFAAPLAPLGGVSGDAKVVVGSAEEKKKRKRKRHRGKKKKAKV